MGRRLDPGLTRSRTGVLRAASASILSMSSKPSTTMYPMPASSAAWMSASDLALPCMTMPCGSAPPARPSRSSPRADHVEPEAFTGKDRHHRRRRERLHREAHPAAGMAAGQAGQVSAGPGAQRRLVDDVCGRAEFGGDLGQRAARDPQVVAVNGSRRRQQRQIWHNRQPRSQVRRSSRVSLRTTTSAFPRSTQTTAGRGIML